MLKTDALPSRTESLLMPICICTSDKHLLLQVSNPKDIMGAEKLIFPGVGAFEQAMGVLRSKEYTEPLKEYIQVTEHILPAGCMCSAA